MAGARTRCAVARLLLLLLAVHMCAGQQAAEGADDGAVFGWGEVMALLEEGSAPHVLVIEPLVAPVGSLVEVTLFGEMFGIGNATTSLAITNKEGEEVTCSKVEWVAADETVAEDEVTCTITVQDDTMLHFRVVVDGVESNEKVVHFVDSDGVFIETVCPSAGRRDGGTRVTVTGQHLKGEQVELLFDNAPCEGELLVEDDSTVVCTATPACKGEDIVRVQARVDGTPADGPELTFSYLDSPVLEMVSPDTGSADHHSHLVSIGVSGLGPEEWECPPARTAFAGDVEALSCQKVEHVDILQCEFPQLPQGVHDILVRVDGVESDSGAVRYRVEVTVDPELTTTEDSTTFYGLMAMTVLMAGFALWYRRKRQREQESFSYFAESL